MAWPSRRERCINTYTKLLARDALPRTTTSTSKPDERSAAPTHTTTRARGTTGTALTRCRCTPIGTGHSASGCVACTTYPTPLLTQQSSSAAGPMETVLVRSDSARDHAASEPGSKGTPSNPSDQRLLLERPSEQRKTQPRG